MSTIDTVVSTSSAAPGGTVLLFSITALAALGLMLVSKKREQQSHRHHLTTKFEKQNLLERRHAAKSQSVSHSHDPLIVMKGEGAFLIDEQGRRYLDSRNNVASIGHQHPIWVKAVCDQVALTNTNSRYLHPLRVELVERILQTLPSQLEVFVL